MGSNIKWNFTKFLVNRVETVVERFAPTKTPESREAVRKLPVFVIPDMELLFRSLQRLL